MLKHKFAVGDNVVIQADGTWPTVRAGLYVVTKLLPIIGDSVQYRAQNALDPHEYVVNEAWMRPADKW